MLIESFCCAMFEVAAARPHERYRVCAPLDPAAIVRREAAAFEASHRAQADKVEEVFAYARRPEGCRTETLLAYFGDHKLFVAHYAKQLTGVPLTVTIRAYELYRNPNPAMFVESLEDVPAVLRDVLADGDLVLTMGAGDIGTFAADLPSLLSDKPNLKVHS